MRECPSRGELKAVLFDVDGTLVDGLSVCVQGLADTYERFGTHRPKDEEIMALIGKPLSVQLKLFQASEPSPEAIDQMITYALERYEVYRHLEREFESAVQSLKLFHSNGIKTALVTSRNHAEVEVLKSTFTAINSVDVIVSASDVVNPKPAADPALLALDQLGVNCENAVFVGDSVFDIQSAQAANVYAVAVTYGSGRREHIQAQMPDVILDTPEELLAWSQAQLPTLCHERKI